MTVSVKSSLTKIRIPRKTADRPIQSAVLETPSPPTAEDARQDAVDAGSSSDQCPVETSAAIRRAIVMAAEDAYV